MFGGLAFLIGGHLAISASGQGGVLVRVDPGQTDPLVSSTAASVAIMRGRPMDGWLRVGSDHVRTQRQLSKWVKVGVEYARISRRRRRAPCVRSRCGPVGAATWLRCSTYGGRRKRRRPTPTTSPASSSVAHDPTALILAEDGGRLVGTVIAGWDGWRGSIPPRRGALSSAPPPRKPVGIGGHRTATRSGCTRLQAIVVGDDPQAMSFWTAGDWSQQLGQVRFVCG